MAYVYPNISISNFEKFFGGKMCHEICLLHYTSEPGWKPKQMNHAAVANNLLGSYEETIEKQFQGSDPDKMKL